MKAAPVLQRLFCALFAIGILVGVITQFQNGLDLELENSYQLFKLFFAMIGLFFISYIAVRGSLPFRENRVVTKKDT